MHVGGSNCRRRFLQNCIRWLCLPEKLSSNGMTRRVWNKDAMHARIPLCCLHSTSPALSTRSRGRLQWMLHAVGVSRKMRTKRCHAWSQASTNIYAFNYVPVYDKTDFQKVRPMWGLSQDSINAYFLSLSFSLSLPYSGICTDFGCAKKAYLLLSHVF